MPLPIITNNGRGKNLAAVAFQCSARVLTLCTAFAVQNSVAALPKIVPLSTADLERALVRVECASGNGSEQHFRATLIDTEQAERTFEIILTTAHGLPSNLVALIQGCAVIGTNDRRYGIDARWRPPQPHRRLTDDWAVLRTDRRMRGDYRRLRVAQMDKLMRAEMLANAVPVRLPLLYPPEERDCRLSNTGLSAAEQSEGLFAHNCRAWQGHSGSPILLSIEDHVVLVGLHIGTRWVVEQPGTVKLGRYMDASILNAIELAARDGRPGDAPVSVASYSKRTQ